MDRIIKEDVSVGSGIIGVFKRMDQKLERVFAEFIDNSTQSYRDHLSELQMIKKSPVCKINIVWNSSEITITDNAFGMSHDDFKHALKLNDPKDNYSENSRSQYGMGLKTAASYLGNWYSIETTMLGSDEKYYSIIDIEDWKINNPTEVDNHVTDAPTGDHYTTIKICKLFKPLTNSIDNTLRKKLALIYEKDLSSGDLEIVLNGRPISKIDPELRVNSETGSEYLDYFEDKFIFNEEEYSYYGWVGILKKASTDDAGFTLSQYGRGIRLNYRPGDLFGKSNSFPYQRMVGEIQLDDKKWKISFNKNDFIWDDGLEKAFVDSLRKNASIKNIRDIANSLRKEKDVLNPSIKPVDAKKNVDTFVKKYEGLRSVTKTVINENVYDNKPIIAIQEDEKTESNIVEITFESIQYSFDIQIKNDMDNLEWLSIQKKEGANSYYLVLNGNVRFFQEYKNKECKNLIIDFAISLALAQLSSIRLGLPLEKSTMFINQLNNILKNTN